MLGIEKIWSWVIQASDAVGQGSVLTQDGKAASLPLFLLSLLGWLPWSQLSACSRWSPGSDAEHRLPLGGGWVSSGQVFKDSSAGLKDRPMLDREPVISALQVQSRVSAACSAPTPGQSGGPLCGHKGGVPGHDLGGQQAAKVLLTSLTPTAPHPSPLPGRAGRENTCFGMFLAGPVWSAGLKVPSRAGPRRCQHTADCTSSCSWPGQPPHSRLLEKIIGWIEVQYRFT